MVDEQYMKGNEVNHFRSYNVMHRYEKDKSSL